MMTESDMVKNYDRKFNEHNYTLNNLLDAAEALKAEMLAKGLTKVKIGEVLPLTISFLLRFINSATEKNKLSRSYLLQNQNEHELYLTVDSLDYFKKFIEYLIRPEITMPTPNDLPPTMTNSPKDQPEIDRLDGLQPDSKIGHGQGLGPKPQVPMIVTPNQE